MQGREVLSISRPIFFSATGAIEASDQQQPGGAGFSPAWTIQKGSEIFGRTGEAGLYVSSPGIRCCFILARGRLFDDGLKPLPL